MVGLVLVLAFMRGIGVIAERHPEGSESMEVNEEEKKGLEEELAGVGDGKGKMAPVPLSEATSIAPV